jgi:hypothetical protein
MIEQNTQKKVEIVIFVTFEILEINTTINKNAIIFQNIYHINKNITKCLMI